MNSAQAKDLLYKSIKDRAFVKDEVTELDAITQANLGWVMNFKTLSLEKDFLGAFVTMFDEAFSHMPSVQVCGMESGALPFVAALSLKSKLCKNAFYIRKSSKKSDLAKTIEGTILKDVPIIVVDDVLNRGNTVKKQMLVLEEEGHRPFGSFTVLRYRDIAFYRQVFGEGLKIESVFQLDDFSRDLPLANLLTPAAAIPDYYAFDGVWRIKLSKHNPYVVVPKSAPARDESHIYIGSDDGYMRALKKETGEVIWQTKVLFGEGGKSILSSPIISNGKIFFGAYDGNFYCLDAKTGKKVWVYMDGEWIGYTPAVSEDGKTVYVGLEFGLFKKHGGIVALDTETGRIKWNYSEMEGLTHASPAYNKKLGVVVCGCNDYFIYCFKVDTGELLWKFKAEDEVKYGAIFDEKKELIIIGSMDGKLYCLSSKTGIPEMTFKAKAGFYSTAAIYNETVIIGSLDKSVYCFNLRTQAKNWEVLTRGRIFSSPLLFKGRVFIGSNDGGVYEIDADTGQVISLTQLTARVVNKIIVEEVEGKRVMYVPTNECELYKFKEK